MSNYLERLENYLRQTQAGYRPHSRREELLTPRQRRRLVHKQGRNWARMVRETGDPL